MGGQKSGGRPCKRALPAERGRVLPWGGAMIMLVLFYLWLGIARALDALVHVALDAREAWLRMRVFRQLRRAQLDGRLK
jgi:hypothetical protein